MGIPVGVVDQTENVTNRSKQLERSLANVPFLTLVGDPAAKRVSGDSTYTCQALLLDRNERLEFILLCHASF